MDEDFWADIDRMLAETSIVPVSKERNEFTFYEFCSQYNINRNAAETRLKDLIAAGQVERLSEDERRVDAKGKRVTRVYRKVK